MPCGECVGLPVPCGVGCGLWLWVGVGVPESWGVVRVLGWPESWGVVCVLGWAVACGLGDGCARPVGVQVGRLSR